MPLLARALAIVSIAVMTVTILAALGIAILTFEPEPQTPAAAAHEQCAFIADFAARKQAELGKGAFLSYSPRLEALDLRGFADTPLYVLDPDRKYLDPDRRPGLQTLSAEERLWKWLLLRHAAAQLPAAPVDCSAEFRVAGLQLDPGKEARTQAAREGGFSSVTSYSHPVTLLGWHLVADRWTSCTTGGVFGGRAPFTIHPDHDGPMMVRRAANGWWIASPGELVSFGPFIPSNDCGDGPKQWATIKAN